MKWNHLILVGHDCLFILKIMSYKLNSTSNKKEYLKVRTLYIKRTPLKFSIQILIGGILLTNTLCLEETHLSTCYTNPSHFFLSKWSQDSLTNFRRSKDSKSLSSSLLLPVIAVDFSNIDVVRLSGVEIFHLETWFIWHSWNTPIKSLQIVVTAKFISQLLMLKFK